MSQFEPAVEYLLSNEGGLINDQKDPGGVTNFGISLRFLQSCGIKYDFDNNDMVDEREIINLTVDQAKLIYKNEFWDKFKFSLIDDQQIATKLFDTTANVGPFQAIKICHTTLYYDCNRFGITIHGIIGNQTMSFINTLMPGPEIAIFLDSYCSRLTNFYSELAIKFDWSSKFSNGWRDRAFKLPPEQ